MIRMELEAWSEKFLKDIFENSKPMRDLAVKAIEEDWDEEKFMEETYKLIATQDFNDYKHYSSKLADFIEECAAELKK